MRYHLLIDADDTLWENNIYYEQAIHEFIEFLNHSSLTHGEVRAVIDEFERLSTGVSPSPLRHPLVCRTTPGMQAQGDSDQGCAESADGAPAGEFPREARAR